MYKYISTLMLIIMIFFLTAFTSIAASTIDLNSLVEGGAQYNGKQVSVQGEALLEALERGQFAWVNINDGTNAMGVWMKLSDAKKIKIYGDYKNKGDIIKVTGIFNRACKEHGGDMDIHAVNVMITASGYPVNEITKTWKVVFSGTLTLITLILVVIYFRTAKLKA